jgi:hypothetical protein
VCIAYSIHACYMSSPLQSLVLIALMLYKERGKNRP